MPYKKSYRSKRRYGIKKRRTRKGSSKFARKMQRNSRSVIRKKYTTVFDIQWASQGSEWASTISHIGGINNTSQGTTTLVNAQNDQNIATDMLLYQYFKISGVAFKLMFAQGTTPEATPIQWSMGYSNNLVLNPALPSARMQTLAAYQTGSCNGLRPISRFFRTATALKRLGIEWCNTTEYPVFNQPNTTLYNGQLPPNSGSSTLVKVFRPVAPTTASPTVGGKIEVTYYVTYKGTKGTQALT